MAASSSGSPSAQTTAARTSCIGSAFCDSQVVTIAERARVAIERPRQRHGQPRGDQLDSLIQRRRLPEALHWRPRLLRPRYSRCGRFRRAASARPRAPLRRRRDRRRRAQRRTAKNSASASPGRGGESATSRLACALAVRAPQRAVQVGDLQRVRWPSAHLQRRRHAQFLGERDVGLGAVGAPAARSRAARAPPRTSGTPPSPRISVAMTGSSDWSSSATMAL